MIYISVYTFIILFYIILRPIVIVIGSASARRQPCALEDASTTTKITITTTSTANHNKRRRNPSKRTKNHTLASVRAFKSSKNELHDTHRTSRFSQNVEPNRLYGRQFLRPIPKCRRTNSRRVTSRILDYRTVALRLLPRTA